MRLPERPDLFGGHPRGMNAADLDGVARTPGAPGLHSVRGSERLLRCGVTEHARNSAAGDFQHCAGTEGPVSGTRLDRRIDRRGAPRFGYVRVLEGGSQGGKGRNSKIEDRKANAEWRMLNAEGRRGELIYD